MSLNLVNYALAKKDRQKAYEDFQTLEVGNRNLFDSESMKLSGSSKKIEGSYWASNLYSSNWVSNNLQPNKTYTMSFDLTLTQEKPTFGHVKDQAFGKLYLYDENKYANSTSMGEISKSQYDSMQKGDTIRVEHTFTTPKNMLDKKADTKILVYSATQRAKGKREDINMEFGNMKLEKGTKATPWTPAPEDTNANPFVVDLAQSNFTAVDNESRINDIENAIINLGGNV